MKSRSLAGFPFPLLDLEIVKDPAGPFFDGFHSPFTPEKEAGQTS